LISFGYVIHGINYRYHHNYGYLTRRWIATSEYFVFMIQEYEYCWLKITKKLIKTS